MLTVEIRFNLLFSKIFKSGIISRSNYSNRIPDELA